MSAGNDKPAQVGPAPGEETFDDIHARTGASETDILTKKMAFKKGLKPEKKLEEMAPMIKELRCAGCKHMACPLAWCMAHGHVDMLYNKQQQQ